MSGQVIGPRESACVLMSEAVPAKDPAGVKADQGKGRARNDDGREALLIPSSGLSIPVDGTARVSLEVHPNT